VNPIASLQGQVAACTAQLEQTTRELETAMNSYDKATLSFRDMDKLERLAHCRELGLYINGKPVSGHQSARQLYDALISHQRRKLKFSDLMRRKYNAERALAKANLTLQTAIAQQDIRSEEVSDPSALSARGMSIPVHSAMKGASHERSKEQTSAY
jgi:hypothetical protein